jgi:hypothetical protein
MDFANPTVSPMQRKMMRSEFPVTSASVRPACNGHQYSMSSDHVTRTD